jgi:hypothetical protein
MTHVLNANFADQVTLLGYDLPQNRVELGASFPITLYLRAEQTMGQNLVIFNHLLDAEAVQRGGADRIPQNFYTTLLWVPGEIVSDSYPVSVDADAPPGVYWLDIGLYPDKQPNFSLPLFVGGQPIDRTSIQIGPIKVGGGPPDLILAKAQPQIPLTLTFSNQITLLGFDLDQSPPEAPNLQLPISNLKSPDLPIRTGKIPNPKFYWQSASTSATDYTVFVHILNPAGHLVAQADAPPAAGAYPTSLWDAGEIVASEHPLPSLPPGAYTMQIGLYNPATGERLPVPGWPDGAVTLLEFEVKP